MFTEYDRFDVAGALYLWLQHNWDGMGDPKYAGYCELTAPGMYRRGGLRDEMSDEESDIYSMLTNDNWREALDYVIGD